MIGTVESLNVVNADLITGGEAIADGVLRVNTTLTTLELSWNAIRGNSAEDLTK